MPTFYPTNIYGERNSKHPSSVPSAVPSSSSPTGSPTTTVDTRLAQDLQIAVDNVGVRSAVNASGIVTSSTFVSAELDGVSVIAEDSCSAWTRYVGSLVIDDTKYRARSLLLRTQFGVTSEEVTEYECRSATIASGVVGALSLGTEYRGNTCDDGDALVWEVHRCSSGYTALCIGTGCSNGGPCEQAAASIGTAVIAPCLGASVNRRLAFNQDKGALAVLMTTFANRGPVIHVTDASLHVHMNRRPHVLVRVAVSDDAVRDTLGGIVSCHALSLGLRPASADDVMLAGQKALVSPGATHVNVTLTQALVPSTNYDIFCTSTTTGGVPLSLTETLDSRSIVTTPCCKAIVVQLTQYVIRSTDDEQRHMVSISVEALPSSTMSVSLHSVEVVNGQLGNISDHFVPSRFTLSSSSNGGSLSRSFAFARGTPLGQFKLTAVLSDDSAYEFSVSITNKGMYTVIPAEDPQPPPSVMTAIFASDGSRIHVHFDVPTNRASLTFGGRFPCSELFTIGLMMSSACEAVWIDDANIDVFDGRLPVGANMTLHTESLRALCTLPKHQAEVCVSDWDAADTLSSLVTAPVTLTVPMVDVMVPSIIGKCAELPVDSTASSGSGSRPWATIENVMDTTDTNVTRVLRMRAVFSQYKNSSRFALGYDVLGPGHSYTVTTRMCNFLGSCGFALRSTSVLLLEYGEIPVVQIWGPVYKTRVPDAGLQLQGEAYLDLCTGTRLIDGLSFVWTIVDKGTGTVVVDAKDQSHDTTRLHLEAYALTAGRSYDITLHATFTDTDATNAATAVVLVKSRPVRALIQTDTGVGQESSIRPGEFAALNARASVDPDTGLHAGLVFEWACTQVLPSYAADCLGISLQNDMPWSSASGLTDIQIIFENEKTLSNITLVATAPDGSRSGMTFMLVKTLAFDQPVVRHLRSDALSKLNVEDDLVVNATVGYQTGVTVEFTVSPQVPNLDGASLTSPVSSAQRPRYGIYTETSVFFKIPGNVLSPDVVYTFTLTSVYANGLGSASKTEIATNGMPRPGSFVVTPRAGVEFTELFAFEARDWDDDDLPLSYSFGIAESTRTGALLQTRSEARVGSHYLASGQEESQYHVDLYVHVFDSLNAYTTASTSVVVTEDSTDGSSLSQLSIDGRRLNAIEGFIGAQFATIDFAQLNSGPQLAGRMRSAVGSALSALNKINCTLVFGAGVVPSVSISDTCAELNRHACTSTPHSCGICLDGYTGQSGHANSRCVVNGMDSSTELEAIVLACPSGCSGHGRCAHSVPSNVTHSRRLVQHALATCSVTSAARANGFATCTAACECSEGWVGASCRYSEDDLAQRRVLRGTLLDATVDIVDAVSDVTNKQDVNDMISVLRNVAVAGELGNTTWEKLADSIGAVVQAADALAEDALHTRRIDDIISTCNEALVALPDVRPKLDNITTARTSSMDTATAYANGQRANRKVLAALGTAMGLQSSRMVRAQTRGEQSMSSVGTSSAVLTLDASFDTNWNTTATDAGSSPREKGSVPEHTLEVVVDGSSSGTVAAMHVNMTGILSQGPALEGLQAPIGDVGLLSRTDNSQLQAYVLRVKEDFVDPVIPYNSSSRLGELGLAPVVLSDALVFDLPMLSSAQIMSNVYAGMCAPGQDAQAPVRFVLPFNMPVGERIGQLPELDVTVHALSCRKGFVSEKNVSCNGLEHRLNCNGTFGGDLFLTCNEYIEHTVSCQMTLFASLESDDGEFGVTGGDPPSCKSISVSYDSVECLCDVCSTPFLRAFDQRRLSSSSSTGSTTLVAMAEFVITDFVSVSEETQNLDASFFGTTTRVWVTILCFVMGMIGMHVTSEVRRGRLDARDKENKVCDSAPLLSCKRGEFVDEAMLDMTRVLMLEYIDTLFPAVYSKQGAMSRFIEEVSNHHTFLVIFYGPTLYKRRHALVEFISTGIMGCFMMALVTSLEMGDQGDAKCPIITSEEACAELMSIYNAETNVCVWSEEDSLCIANDAVSTNEILTMMSTILITMALSGPFRVLYGWLFGIFAYSGEDLQGLVAVGNGASVTPASNDPLGSSTSHMSLGNKKVANDQGGYWSLLASSLAVHVPNAISSTRNKLFTDTAETRRIRTDGAAACCIPELLAQAEFSSLTRAMGEHLTDCDAKQVPYTGRAVGRRTHDLPTANKGFCDYWRITMLPEGGFVWDSLDHVSAVLHEVFYSSTAAVTTLSCYDDASAGAALFTLLVIDLLGRNTQRAKIFEAKASTHVKSGKVYSLFARACAFAVVMLLNCCLVYMCILFAAVKSQKWQSFWLLQAGFYLTFMVTIEMTLEAVFLHYIIPTQAWKDILLVKAEIAALLSNPAALRELLERTCNFGSDIESQVISSKLTFDAMRHLSVAYITAMHVPHLFESGVVLLFKSFHPRSMLNTKGEAEAAIALQLGAMPAMAWILAKLSSLSMTSVLVWVGTQPMVVQKVLVNAPLPILSSIMAGVIYVASVETPLLVNFIMALVVILFVGTFAFVGNNVRIAVNKGVERDKKDMDIAREARGSRSDAGRSCGNGTGNSVVTVQARRRSIVNPDFVSESDSTGPDVETRESKALMVASRGGVSLQTPKQQKQEQHDEGQERSVIDSVECIEPCGVGGAAEDAAMVSAVHAGADDVSTSLVEDTLKEEVHEADCLDLRADASASNDIVFATAKLKSNVCSSDSAVTVQPRRRSIMNVDFVSESDSVGSDVETRDSEALMMASRDAEVLQSPKQIHQQEQEQHDEGHKLGVVNSMRRQNSAEDAASGIGVHPEACVTTSHLVEDSSKDEVIVVVGRDLLSDSSCPPTKNKVSAKMKKSKKKKSTKKKSTKKTMTKNVN